MVGSSLRVEYRRFLTNLIFPELVIVTISFELFIWATVDLNFSSGVLRIARVFSPISLISNNLQSEPSRWVFSKFSKSSLDGVFSILKIPLKNFKPTVAQINNSKEMVTITSSGKIRLVRKRLKSTLRDEPIATA